MGAYPAVGGIRDYEKSLEHHLKILKKDSSVCIFPGNTRTEIVDPRKIRGGVAFLAHKTGSPVIPVGIKGLHTAGLKKKRVSVVYGEPLYVKDIFKGTDTISYDSYRDGARYILNAIKALIQ